jgi:2-succinyl-5-enolpyruvyl-6-hydroxy-3-cyclohexene-1-carboxylate synthase
MNQELATHLIQELVSWGVREFCICPSSRNAPWVAVLNANSEQLQVYHFYEERSAAFFALGRIKQTHRPVAVVTTSGTALGELFPATMEAHYSGLPLVLLTADRPRHYRGSGAPQSAEQVNLFGIYVSASLDFEGQEKCNLSQIPANRPLHINACFDEPLLNSQKNFKESSYRHSFEFPSFSPSLPRNFSTLDFQEIKNFVQKLNYPFVVVSGLQPFEREGVAQYLENPHLF